MRLRLITKTTSFVQGQVGSKSSRLVNTVWRIAFPFSWTQTVLRLLFVCYLFYGRIESLGVAVFTRVDANVCWRDIFPIATVDNQYETIWFYLRTSKIIHSKSLTGKLGRNSGSDKGKPLKHMRVNQSSVSNSQIVQMRQL